jgi:sigma-B regulation protein RsbU (phosphoserine phosphatase)
MTSKIDEQRQYQRELDRLRDEKAALQVQSKLLENFIALARSSAESPLLSAVLEDTLSVATKLCSAETGSLFLLDARGVVSDSILTRRDTTENQRSTIIGSVLDRGLAGWVKQHRRIGLIQDTRSDDRWVDLPDQPYSIRSALAVPICRGERMLGILTLLHSQPAHFSEDAAEQMELTAAQMAVALDNARLYAKLNRYARALNAELEKGKKIQRDFLPNDIPKIPGWEIGTCFHPARQVSGDFYDVFQLPKGYLVAVIGDVCDKGVGSALFMALVRSLIRVFSGKMHLSGMSLSMDDADNNKNLGPEIRIALNAVTLTNSYIAREHNDLNMFTTLFVGVLNPKTGKLAYVNGGHEPILIIGPRGVRERLGPTGTFVGAIEDSSFAVAISKIEPGETMLGFTDGVVEALSPEGELYTKSRLYRQIEKPIVSAGALIDAIRTDLFNHIRHAPQFDDITMLGVHRKGHV